MKVIIAPRAEAQMARRRDWWRKNREKAPDLFDEELADAVERLRHDAGALPVFARRAGHTIRRYLMPKTQCHLYLEVTEDPEQVLVLAVGGGRRKRPPRFRFQEAAETS